MHRNLSRYIWYEQLQLYVVLHCVWYLLRFHLIIVYQNPLWLNIYTFANMDVNMENHDRATSTVDTNGYSNSSSASSEQHTGMRIENL